MFFLVGNISSKSNSISIYDYCWLFFSNVFLSRFTTSTNLPNLVLSITNSISTLEGLQEVENFIKTTPNLGNAADAFNQAVENINLNIRWRSRNFPLIDAWLKRLTKSL